jgi:hypothetical protein
MTGAQVYAGLGQFPVAPGYAQMSGVEIPWLYSKKIASKFQDIAVFADITSGEYEGEIKNYGDNLHIRIEPDIQIYDYQMNATLNYYTPRDTVVTLTIDKGQYYGLKLDAVSAQQMDINHVPRWLNNASYQLSARLDTRGLAWLVTQASATTQGVAAGRSGLWNIGAAAAPVVVTKANATDVLMMLEAVLDELAVPDAGRFVVIPPAMSYRAKIGDLKAVNTTGDSQSPLRNGRLGPIGKFSVHQSNRLPVTVDGGYNCYSIPFGWKGATAFAQTVTISESLQTPDFFGRLYRGLQVFGYKVVHPEYLGVLYCRFADVAEGS